MLAIPAAAQSKGVAMFFRAGYTHLNTGTQSMAAVARPVSSFRGNYYGIGGEGYWKSGKLLVGLDGMVTTHGPTSKNEFYAEPFTVTSSTRLGYVAYETNDLFFYPAFGVGAGLLGITTYTKHDRVRTNVNTMFLFSPSAEISVNADKLVYTFPNGRSMGAFVFGIRAGYRFSHPSSNWQKLPSEDTPRTKMSIDGYYIAIALGAANLRHKQQAR